MLAPPVLDFLIPVSLFFLIGFVFSVAVGAWQRSRHLKTVVDFNTRLLDRLGSVKDFSEFLQTDAGVTFVRSFATASPATSPQQRIFRAAQNGIVLLALGIGLLLFAWVHTFSDIEGRAALLTIGVVTTSLGAGYLVSSAVSYRLAGTLGILREPDSQRPHQLA